MGEVAFLELKQLEYFLQLCDDLSFTSAARKLFITQQALSRSIHNLEKELGVPLFVRNPGSLTKTEAGAEYEKAVRKALNGLNTAARKLKAADTPVLLHYGTPHSMLEDTDHWLKEFNKAFPMTTVQVKEQTDQKNLEQLLNYRLHLACITGKDPAQMYPEQLHTIKLFDIRMILLMPHSHPLAGREFLTPQDLKNQPVITTQTDYFGVQHFTDYCKKSGVDILTSLASVDRLICLQACLHGRGLFLLPAEADISLLQGDHFASVPFTNGDYTAPFYLVTRKGEQLEPPVRDFYQFLIKHVVCLHQ